MHFKLKETIRLYCCTVRDLFIAYWLSRVGRAPWRTLEELRGRTSVQRRRPASDTLNRLKSTLVHLHVVAAGNRTSVRADGRGQLRWGASPPSRVSTLFGSSNWKRHCPALVAQVKRLPRVPGRLPAPSYWGVTSKNNIEMPAANPAAGTSTSIPVTLLVQYPPQTDPPQSCPICHKIPLVNVRQIRAHASRIHRGASVHRTCRKCKSVDCNKINSSPL